MEQGNYNVGDGNIGVSILTRGKPRVEPTVGDLLSMVVRKFQSSLEENPEWNPSRNSAKKLFLQFQSSLEENPEWNSRIK